MKRLTLAVLCLTLGVRACGLPTTNAAMLGLIPTATAQSVNTEIHINTWYVCGTYDGLNVRTSAGTDYPIIQTILDGRSINEPKEPVTVGLSQWGKIEIDGVTGWVNLRYVCER